MKSMGLNEIRKAFLDFYAKKDHFVVDSYSLVPQDDKSLLLVNAGMQPLKKYFMGLDKPPKNRMATCQKCFRTSDIENVGVTARHATFFEMLGNFSFGDYFKETSIQYGWEFITEVLELPVDKIWPSVYLEDDEAFAIWRDIIKIPEERITRLGKEDNFWEIGTGPCGPCSEIYYDRGEAFGCGDPDCRPGCECERFLEFWNHVFTQYDKDEQGTYHLLEHPNIDTGMGIERIACIMQDVDNIYEIDTNKIILNKVCDLCDVKFGTSEVKDKSIKILTDHIKAITFMVSDGIMPNNEGRGYVLRRLLRRATRHAKLLGVENSMLSELSQTVIDVYSVSYTYLLDKKEFIKKIIALEEERFNQTLDQGLVILSEQINTLKSQNKTVLSGERAFKLYDTFGFPFELTKEILEENSMSVDASSFETQMDLQREKARSARGSSDKQAWKTDVLTQMAKDFTCEFVGYTMLKTSSNVIGILDDEVIDGAQKGQTVKVILDTTPFYPEGGGQVGDVGVLYSDAFLGKVVGTHKNTNGLIWHEVLIEKGVLKFGMRVSAEVDKAKRLSTSRNHSMTHILHKALREVLGNHVEQAGSMVSPERLRFDFSHFEAISSSDVDRIEMIVNSKIFDSLPIRVQEMALSEAKNKGAMALFDEKYGQNVRVVEMGEYSIELCGGTHLSNTSQAGMFKIISEGGVASGVRRIEATTGENVYHLLTQLDHKVQLVSDILKVNANEIDSRVNTLLDENKTLQKENERLRQEKLLDQMDHIIEDAKEINAYQVITAKFEQMDLGALRILGDQVVNRLANSIVVFANKGEQKVEFLAMVSEGAIQKGAHAGQIIKEVAKIAGGGGGGKPNMAQAGGKYPEKVDEALEKVYALIQ